MAAQHLSRVTLRAGDHLFHQGERADALYLVVDGELEILAEGTAGRHHLGSLGSGAYWASSGS